jgi:hypothetical protein
MSGGPRLDDLWRPMTGERVAAAAARGTAGFSLDPLGDSGGEAAIPYTVDFHPAFDAVRRAAVQLAGLLVLAASGAKGGGPDHPLMNVARLSLAEGADLALRLKAPPAAMHLHYHLIQAIEGVERALRVAETTVGGARNDVSAVAGLLRGGHEHLRAASNLLPGLQLTDFSRACCAVGVAGSRPRFEASAGI